MDTVSTDLSSKSARIEDFRNKLSGFADFKNREDRGSTANFGRNSYCLKVRIVDPYKRGS